MRAECTLHRTGDAASRTPPRRRPWRNHARALFRGAVCIESGDEAPSALLSIQNRRCPCGVQVGRMTTRTPNAWRTPRVRPCPARFRLTRCQSFFERGVLIGSFRVRLSTSSFRPVVRYSIRGRTRGRSVMGGCRARQGQGPWARGRGPEARGHGPEARGQRPEARGQRPGAWGRGMVQGQGQGQGQGQVRCSFVPVLPHPRRPDHTRGQKRRAPPVGRGGLLSVNSQRSLPKSENEKKHTSVHVKNDTTPRIACTVQRSSGGTEQRRNGAPRPRRAQSVHSRAGDVRTSTRQRTGSDAVSPHSTRACIPSDS